MPPITSNDVTIEIPDNTLVPYEGIDLIGKGQKGWDIPLNQNFLNLASKVKALFVSLNDKADTSHTHTPDHTHTNKTFLDALNQTVLDGKSNTNHSHTLGLSDIIDLLPALDSKSDTSHTHTPDHAHTNKTFLDTLTQTVLDNKSNANHSHTLGVSDITGLKYGITAVGTPLTPIIPISLVPIDVGVSIDASDVTAQVFDIGNFIMISIRGNANITASTAIAVSSHYFGFDLSPVSSYFLDKKYSIPVSADNTLITVDTGTGGPVKYPILLQMPISTTLLQLRVASAPPTFPRICSVSPYPINIYIKK